MTSLVLLFAALSVMPLVAEAQQTLPNAPSYQTMALFGEQASSSQDGEPQQNPTAGGQKSASQDPIKEEDKQRILGIVPTRNVVLDGHADPITRGQKFDLWIHSAIDPFAFAVAGITAGVEQAEHSYAGYGDGAAGFGKRYGAAYADTVDSRFWGKALLPSIFHQDPRYFRADVGGIKHRMGYAVASVVRCKGDDGRWQFAYSNISGNFIGGAIANAYYPAQDRGAGLVIDRGLIVTAEGAVGLIVAEFYPDVIAHFKKKKN